MLLPSVLTNVNVKFNGIDFSARAEEVILPKISHKTEEWHGVGMAGPVEISVGLEKLEAQFKFMEQSSEAYLSAALNATGFVNAIVLGNLRRQGGPSEPIVSVLRGFIKTIEAGNWKGGDPKAATQTVTMSVYSWTLNRNGIPLVTIDMENGIYLLGPFDQHEAVRKNLLIS